MVGLSRDSDGPAENWEYYATVGTDVDLTTAQPGAVPSTPKKAARGFMVGASGNLRVTRFPAGGDELLAVVAGVFYPLPISALKTADTTATGVIVIW